MERAPLDDGAQSSQNSHETRICALEQAMSGIEVELKQLRQHMNDGFDLLRESLLEVRRSLGEIVARMDRQDARMDRQDARADRQDQRADRQDQRADRQDQRADRQDGRMDRLESQIRWTIGLQVATILGVLGIGVTTISLLVQHLR